MNRDRTRRALARERGILRLEDRLARELATVQTRLSDSARAALPDTGEPLDKDAGRRLLAKLASASKSSSLTAAATRRAARTAGELVALGWRDAGEMIAEQTRRAGFGADTYRVSEADAAAYQRLARGVLDKLADDAYEQLKRVVEQGLRDGLTDRVIGHLIHKLDIGLAKSHAQSWAATESTRFYNIGTVARGADSDSLWGYEYWNPDDARTTDTCRGYVGRRVAKEALRDVPPFHWRCRTRMFPIMAEEITGEPVQPEGTELPSDAAPADGFGGDPRRMVPSLAP